MTTDVRVVAIGAGRIARVHAAAYRSVSRGRLVGCTDPATDVADKLAADFDLRVYPDLAAVLDDGTVDAVLIASPNDLHPEQTIAALDANKHVFCQKPIALTVDQADRVVERATRSDRVVQFGFMLRFTPPIPTLARRVAAGEIGDPIAAQAAVFGWEPSNDWFYDPARGGGVILDTLVHFADLVLWMLGPAASVHTEGGAYVLDGAKRFRSPDNATMVVRHASGAVSSMYVSWTAGHGNFTVDVYGTDGHAGVDLVRSQGMSAFRPTRADQTVTGSTTGWSYPDMVWDYGYAGEQQHFVDRIAGIAGSSSAGTPRAARDALALVLAAQRSLDEQRTVTL
jgi:myo-inositol 2-dehydrogenase/D-chiro-inositol 1-dehydrogenase